MNWIKVAVITLSTIAISVLVALLYLQLKEDISFSPLKTAPELVRIRTDDLLLRYPNIVGIQVVSADLSKNIRYILYTSIRDEEVKKLYDLFLLKSITTEVPVFTNNTVQNTRMIRLINHEYVCSPFEETISYDFLPESGKYITTVCAMSIPPDYGNFDGIVGVFLRKPPTELESDILRIEIRSLAELIWKESSKKD